MSRGPKARKEKLSIYLAKNSKVDDVSLLKIENTKPSILLEIEGFESSRLYIKKEPPEYSPPWTKLFTARSEVEEDAFGKSKSVGAVLVVSLADSKFILSFGTGFHLVSEECIERDFGLRVTLNSVEPAKLRSLDKASYDHNPLNYRTQSTKEVDIFDLHMNSEMEMLYAVTGASSVAQFGSHITGRDALTIITDSKLDALPEILEEAYRRYKQKLPEDFEWVDNINKVRDNDEIEILDLELENVLVGHDHSNLWLGEPEIVDWENHVGYSFDLYPKTDRHVVLHLDDLLSYLAGKTLSVTVDVLKSTHIHINNSEYQAIKSWSAYRCVYAEISYGGDKFILRNATWYKVDPGFVNKIDLQLRSISVYDYALPIYSHDREEEYNSYLGSSDSSMCLLDKKNIKIGGAYDKLEFCDLVRSGRDLIHVKYYRSSSTLSHLFSQGCVSAEAFIVDSEFRQKLNLKLPPSIKLSDPDSRPNPSDYQVVYAIATTKKLPDELPFFSKVTLKNALKVLRGLNFDVAISTIAVDPLLACKKKIKPNKSKVL
ncbi:TIGR04141 family sporadically distributed protein [Pseudomonas chlororaphis]|nr:TIGR04141 family sporadically distributed protein [Pseudomonas chlororaphis]